MLSFDKIRTTPELALLKSRFMPVKLYFERLVTHFLTLAPSAFGTMVRGKKRPYNRSRLSLLSLGGKEGMVIIYSLKFYAVL